MSRYKGTVAISPGHNFGTGARAHDGTDEWWWNSAVGRALERALKKRGYRVVMLERDRSLDYTAAMKKLGRAMKLMGADIALELHFNAAIPRARGYEFLYWQGSKKSRALARHLAESFGKGFSAILPRTGWVRRTKGYKALWLRPWTQAQRLQRRGAEYCYYTPCPVVICEPGFATNTHDWAQLKYKTEQVAHSYADGVDKYFVEVAA